jgi:hypothetical protein
VKKVEISSILNALDLDDVGTVADINGGSADIAAALHNRFGSKISLICLDGSGQHIKLPEKAVAKYRRKLIDAGVDRTAINVVTTQRQLKTYGASMGGYGAAAKGSTVFVISPQSTLDKEIVPWEMHYKKVWFRDFSGEYGDASISSQRPLDV